MLVGLLALQGDVAEHRAALAELGVESRPVRTPGDLSGVDGLILPGGESTTMSMLLESSGLADPLAHHLARGLPAFGTCAGMILLAREITDGRPYQVCYGAVDLVVRRNGYGRQLQSFETDLDVALGEHPSSADGRPLHAVFIRAPVVESVGPGVEVLATFPSPVPSPSPSPVICRQGSVLVTSFHPELTGDRRLHELFVSMIAARSARSNNGAGPHAPSATESESSPTTGDLATSLESHP